MIAAKTPLSICLHYLSTLPQSPTNLLRVVSAPRMPAIKTLVALAITIVAPTPRAPVLVLETDSARLPRARPICFNLRLIETCAQTRGTERTHGAVCASRPWYARLARHTWYLLYAEDGVCQRVAIPSHYAVLDRNVVELLLQPRV
jgi:hypothetical protein